MFQDPCSAGRCESMRSVTESSADKTDMLPLVGAAAPKGAATAPTWLALWWGAMMLSPPTPAAGRRSTPTADRRSMAGAALAGLIGCERSRAGLRPGCIDALGRGVGALGGFCGARWPSSVLALLKRILGLCMSAGPCDWASA